MTHGHICPAADNRWGKAAMDQSFILTNMCSQDGSLNVGGWQKINVALGRCSSNSFHWNYFKRSNVNILTVFYHILAINVHS